MSEENGVTHKSSTSGHKMLDTEKLRQAQDSGSKPKYTDLYRVLAIQVAYAVFQKSFNLLRGGYWILTGKFFKARTTKYEGSAHVKNILMRYKYDVLLAQNTQDDFTTYHHSFQEPEYVLRDEVSLYSMSPHTATFVEVATPDAEIWRGKYGAFSRQAQYDQAIRVITMPNESFLRLTDKLGDTKSRVMIIQNTSRSGSTLMCRVIEDTDRCVSWCEPDGFNSAIKLITDKNITDKVYGSRLLRGVIRMYCKPQLGWGDRQPVGYCLKLCNPAMFGAEILHEFFPEYKQLFLYRHGEKVMRSLEALAEAMPIIKLISLLASIHPYLTRVAVQQTGCSGEFMGKMNFTMNYHFGEVGMLAWSTAMSVYIKCWKKGIPIHAAKYEDLIKDPEYCVKKIFEFFDMPQELVAPSLRAFARDSQAGSKASMAQLNQKRKMAPLRPENRKCMDMMCSFFGVPNWENDFVLPNTITHKDIENDPLYISDKEFLNTFNNSEVC